MLLSQCARVSGVTFWLISSKSPLRRASSSSFSVSVKQSYLSKNDSQVWTSSVQNQPQFKFHLSLFFSRFSASRWSLVKLLSCSDADCMVEAILLLMLSLVGSDSSRCRDKVACWCPVWEHSVVLLARLSAIVVTMSSKSIGIRCFSSSCSCVCFRSAWVFCGNHLSALWPVVFRWLWRSGRPPVCSTVT